MMTIDQVQELGESRCPQGMSFVPSAHGWAWLPEGFHPVPLSELDSEDGSTPQDNS